MKRTINQLPEELRGSLEEISVEGIFKKRVSGEIGIVIQIDGDHYMYTFSNTKIGEKMKEKVKVRDMFGEHLCNTCEFTKSGELCPKVADLSVETCRRYYLDEIESFLESKRIEKYDFIKQGVESFNCRREYLIVIECDRYQ